MTTASTSSSVTAEPIPTPSAWTARSISSSATLSPACRARTHTPLVSRSRPRFSISSKRTVRRSFATSRARSSSAPRPAYASTHPSSPQLHRRPPGFEQTWPISPAEPRPTRRPAVHDDPAAHARPPEHAEERREAPAGAETALGLDRDVDVVADEHRSRELVLEHLPERIGVVPPVDVGDLDTVPDVVSIEPGAPTPTPAIPIGSIPASSSAALIASASSSVTASGPPARGVSRRALPSTTDPPSVTTAWIFVPPRSRPPIILVGEAVSLTEAGARRPRCVSGSPARSIPRRCDARGRGAARDTRR